MIAERAAAEGVGIRTIASFATTALPMQGFVFGYGAESKDVLSQAMTLLIALYDAV